MFNQRVLLALEYHNLTPMEIVGGRKVQAITNFSINKNLIADISNEVMSPSAVTSADTTNYCKRVDHPFASPAGQYFGSHIDHILVLLKSIQSMSILFSDLF